MSDTVEGKENSFLEILRLGQSALSKTTSHFQAWVAEYAHRVTPEQWRTVLLQVVSPTGSFQLEQGTPPVYTYRGAAQQVVATILQAGKFDLAKQLYTALLQPEDFQELLLSRDDLCELLMQQVASFERKGLIKSANLLREYIFEIKPSHVANNLALVSRFAPLDDEFRLAIYTQAAVDTLHEFPDADRRQIMPILQKLAEYKHYEPFLSLAEAFVRLSPAVEQAPLYGVLAQIASYCFDDDSTQYQGLWHPRDLIDFRTSRQFVYTTETYLPVAEGMVKVAEDWPRDSQEWTSLMGEAATYFGIAGNVAQMQRIIYQIIESWPLEKLKNSIKLVNRFTYDIAYQFLLRVCYCLPYFSDNQKQIRDYQQASAAAYSKCIQSQHLDLVNDQTWKKEPILDRSRLMRVGYLSMTFRRHSVGFLSHQALGYHNSDKVETFLYSINTDRRDEIRDYFMSNTTHFRDFNELPIPEIVQRIRADQLDILVFLDSTTNRVGCDILALRVAPIQMVWLGGDSAGLPEIDYFLIDPHILEESADQDYSEKLLRLPTFVAIDHFEVSEVDLEKFRAALYIDPEQMVFWTASMGMKRYPESIANQLEILRQVPDSILIIKGLGDMATLQQAYLQTAHQKGVEQQLRFLKRTATEEIHRGQLGIADIILDTFPYTGATHSIEALWRGVPVLTQVGHHYYSRMTYSLLQSIGEMDACIAMSAEEFIEKGIQLGQDPQLRERLKQRLHNTRKSSILWNSRRFARSLETAYRHVLQQGSVQGYCAEPEDEPLVTLPSAADWNSLGLQHYQQGLTRSRDRSTAWESALSCWRRGLDRDPHHLPCHLNRIFVTGMLMDRVAALREAFEVLIALQVASPTLDTWTTAEDLARVLVWHRSNIAPEGVVCLRDRYVHTLARWIGEYLIYFYRPECLQYWRLALQANPRDTEAHLKVGLALLLQSQAAGIHHLDQVLFLHPDHSRALLARQYASQLFGRAHSRGKRFAPSPSPVESAVNYEGYRLTLEPSLTSVSTTVLLAEGKWFEPEIELCRQILNPGMVVMDVGANIGVYTFLAASCVGSTGKVYAIEPTPSCIACLETTIRQNDLQQVVIPIVAAAGDRQDRVLLVGNQTSTENRIASSEAVDSSQAGEWVDQITLDHLWQREGQPQVSLIKVDAEGRELQCFQGAEQILRLCQPILLFENQHGSQSTGQASVSFLTSFGYQFYVYQQSLHRLKQIPVGAPIPKVLNLLAATQTSQDLLQASGFSCS